MSCRAVLPPPRAIGAIAAILLLTFPGLRATEDVTDLVEVDAFAIGSGEFSRADANLDRSVDISDAISILGYLFLGGQTTCEDALDVDDTGTLDLTDPIYLLGYLYLGGPPPRPPFGQGVCGPDPTVDRLTCRAYPPCGSPPPTQFAVAVENTSDEVIYAPLLVVIESISNPAVGVSDPDGYIDDKPYFDYTSSLAGGVFGPGSQTSFRTWTFTNPAAVRFTFTVSVLGNVGGEAGWLPALDPLGDDEAPPDRADTEVSLARVSYRIRTPGMLFRTQEEGGVVYQALSVHGKKHGLREGIGKPAIPTYTQIVAIPRGTQMRVTVDQGDEHVYGGMRILPTQRPPEDNLQTPEPPFEVDAQLYQTDTDYPEDLVVTRELEFRGCRMGIVQVALGQYNPARRTLRVFGEVQVGIRFEGLPMAGQGADAGLFVDDDVRDLAAESVLSVAALNYEVAARDRLAIVHDRVALLTADLLIIADRAYEDDVERLAEHKRDRGLTTLVSYTDDIGATSADIENRIRAVFLTRRISYVLLFGDAEDIPPQYVTRHPTGHSPNRIGTDLYYATMGNADDIIPDLAIGRIPVNSAGEAEVVVDKIIDYESSPPLGFAFYDRAAMAAYFQDNDDNGRADRGFAETIEEIHGFLAGEGYSPERVFTTNSSDPEEWNDGTAIPAHLEMPGFPWDGDSGDITDTIENGCFLVAHRDHGDWSGWSHPGYTTVNINGLTNGGMLPVVGSINCQTGWFDRETDEEGVGTAGESFAERFLTRDGGGAIGVFAATRNSPSWPNNELLLGMLDCVWPTLIAGYPGLGDVEASGIAGSRELGWMLNYGKLRVVATYPTELDGPPNLDGITLHQRELEIYHVIGDPTLQIRTTYPFRLVAALPDIPELLTEYHFDLPPSFRDARLAIVQDGDVVGRGYVTAEGGVVYLPDNSPLAPRQDTVLVAIQEGAHPFRVPLRFEQGCEVYSLNVPTMTMGRNALTRYTGDEECGLEEPMTRDLQGMGHQMTSPSGFVGTDEFLFVGDNMSGGIEMLRFVPGEFPTPVAGSPFANEGGQPMFFEVDPEGRTLFATTGDRFVEVFQITSDSLRRLGGGFAPPGRSRDLALYETTRGARFLYVGMMSAPRGVFVARVFPDGVEPLGTFNLEELGASRPGYSLMVSPDGRLYTVDLDRGIFGMEIDEGDASLRLIGGSPFALDAFCDTAAMSSDGSRIWADLPNAPNGPMVVTLAVGEKGELEIIGSTRSHRTIRFLRPDCAEECLYGASRGDDGIARWDILPDGTLEYIGLTPDPVASGEPAALWTR